MRIASPAGALPVPTAAWAELPVSRAGGTTPEGAAVPTDSDLGKGRHQCLANGGAHPWGEAARVGDPCTQINIGCRPYLRWWTEILCEVTRMLSPTFGLVVTNTYSAAGPADTGTPRSDDTRYRTFLRAFNLMDLKDLHLVPPHIYSCF